MTTDLGLLELAAKAAGEYIFIDSDGRAWVKGTCVAWVPQDDDGQALRLATRLRIGIKYYDNAPPELGLPRVCAVASAPCDRYLAVTPERDDDDTAIRRAIFLTAVEIGRNME